MPPRGSHGWKINYARNHKIWGERLGKTLSILGADADDLGPILAAQRMRELHEAQTEARDLQTRLAACERDIARWCWMDAKSKEALIAVLGEDAGLVQALRQNLRHLDECPAKFRITLSAEDRAAGWKVEQKTCTCGLAARLPPEPSK